MLLHNNLLPITSMRSDSHPSLPSVSQSVRPLLHATIHPCSPSIPARGHRGPKKIPSLAYRDCLRPCRFAGVPGRSSGRCVPPRRRLVSGRFLCFDRDRLLVRPSPPQPLLLDKPACALTDRCHSRSLVMLLSEAVSMEAERGVARGQTRRRRGTSRDGAALQWRERCFRCVRRVCCSILCSSVTQATPQAGRRHQAPPLPTTPPPRPPQTHIHTHTHDVVSLNEFFIHLLDKDTWEEKIAKTL